MAFCKKLTFIFCLVNSFYCYASHPHSSEDLCADCHQELPSILTHLPRLYFGVTGHGCMPISTISMLDNIRRKIGLVTRNIKVIDGCGGGGVVAGLEKTFFNAVYTSVEMDASWSRFVAPKDYEKNPIHPFSWGYSARIGARLGNSIIYALVGVEENKIRGEQHSENAHYSKIISRNYGDPGLEPAYFVSEFIGAQKKSHLRLGIGFEHYVYTNFRMRFDFLWSLPKVYESKVEQSVNIHREDALVSQGPGYVRLSKYTIRIGINYVF